MALEQGQFREVDRARRFEIAKIIAPLKPICAAASRVRIEAGDALSFDTLFAVMFSVARAGCTGADFEVPGRARRLAHTFPRTNNGEAPRDESPAGPLGLVVSVSVDRLMVWSQSEAYGTSAEPALALPWPLADADVIELRRALRELVTARWPTQARTRADRTLIVDAAGSTRADDLLHLLEVLVRDRDGAELFPERLFRAPTPPRRRREPPPIEEGRPGQASDEVMADSVPWGAKVHLEDVAIGVTPLMFKIQIEHRPVELRFEREGYLPCMATIEEVSKRVSCVLREAPGR